MTEKELFGEPETATIERPENMLGRWLRYKEDDRENFEIYDVTAYDPLTDTLTYEWGGQIKTVSAKMIDQGILFRPESVIANPYTDTSLMNKVSAELRQTEGIEHNEQVVEETQQTNTNNYPQNAPTPQPIVLPENNGIILTAIENLKKKEETSTLEININISLPYSYEKLIEGCDFLGIEQEETLKGIIINTLEGKSFEDIINIFVKGANV